MSRIGKKPVSVPAGVTANVSGQLVKIKGAKGELSFEVPEEVSVALENGAIAVQPRSQTKRARALWGTSRARIASSASPTIRPACIRGSRRCRCPTSACPPAAATAAGRSSPCSAAISAGWRGRRCFWTWTWW